MNDFWKSAGMHLVEVNAEGWLGVTPDFLRAYYTRPEVHPIDTSCAEETRLFEDLMADPFMAVPKERLDSLADQDAAYNYRTVLGLRAHLVEAGSLEGAYLRMMRTRDLDIPPVFLDQLVHVIARNILEKCDDPVRLRAGELFFRAQSVTTDDGRVMLADEEIVSMHAATGGLGSLGQLLVDSETPLRKVELDVLDETSKDAYWERSDRFDMVIDFRFTQPALDAFSRVAEAWIEHFLKLKVLIEPRQSIKDEQWSWHIGMDAESNRILNTLYEGNALAPDDEELLIALFRMRVEEEDALIETMRGKPIYLGLAMNPKKIVKMKPQNLLMNMPLPREV